MDFWLIAFIFIVTCSIVGCVCYRIGCVQTEGKFITDDDEILNAEEIQ